MQATYLINPNYPNLAARDESLTRIISTIYDHVFSGIGAYWAPSKLQDLAEYLYTALSTNNFDRVTLTTDKSQIGTVLRCLVFDEFTLSVDKRTFVVYINADYFDTL